MARTRKTTHSEIPQPLESPWRMPGFFAATVLVTAITMYALAIIAGPGSALCSPTPVWVPGT